MVDTGLDTVFEYELMCPSGTITYYYTTNNEPSSKSNFFEKNETSIDIILNDSRRVKCYSRVVESQGKSFSPLYKPLIAI